MRTEFDTRESIVWKRTNLAVAQAQITSSDRHTAAAVTFNSRPAPQTILPLPLSPGSRLTLLSAALSRWKPADWFRGSGRSAGGGDGGSSAAGLPLVQQLPLSEDEAPVARLSLLLSGETQLFLSLGSLRVG